MTGGNIGSNTTGGELTAFDNSVVNISGGNVLTDRDGLGGYVTAIQNSTINIRGGHISGDLEADQSATINLYGGVSAVLINPKDVGNNLDPNYQGYSVYVLFGNLSDGSRVNEKRVAVQNGTGAKFTINGLAPDNKMLLTLANLANNVYTGTGGFGQFGFIGTNADYVPSQKSNQGFKALVFGNGDLSQIVIAIRGTDVSDLLIAEKNLIADASFINGIPSLNFQTSVAYAAALVQTVHMVSPNASITLTGHSLGAAIAQLVGYASGLCAVTFDAPGPARFYGQLQAQLQPAFGLGTCYAIVDYRLRSEQVSLIGGQIGSTVTLAEPGYTVFWGTNLGKAAEAIASYDTIYELHKMQTMVNQVTLHPQPVDATGEVNVLPALQKAATETLLSKGPKAIVTYAFGFAIADTTTYLFDPSSGSDYVLTADTNSPLFASLILPAIDDVAAYKVRYHIGNTWSNFQSLQPRTKYTLAQPANAIEFQPLDAYGQATVLPDGFDFGASFKATGNFSGTLAIDNTLAAVTGQLLLEGVADQSKIVSPVGSLTFEFRTPATTTVLFARTATLTTDAVNSRLGDYTLVGVTPGTYDIAIKSRNSLRTVVHNVTIAGSTGTIPLAVLPTGDANGDNLVNIGDFGLLINAYGSSLYDGTGLYNPNVDFNDDGLVDLGDFGLLVNNYGLSGDL